MVLQPLKWGCCPKASTSGSQRTIESWIWLKYTIIDRLRVDALTCSICTHFKGKLEGMHNYNPAHIKGSRKKWTSNFKDHAASTMHMQAMSLCPAKTKTSEQKSTWSEHMTGHHSILNSSTALACLVSKRHKTDMHLSHLSGISQISTWWVGTMDRRSGRRTGAVEWGVEGGGTRWGDRGGGRRRVGGGPVWEGWAPWTVWGGRGDEEATVSCHGGGGREKILAADCGVLDRNGGSWRGRRDCGGQ